VAGESNMKIKTLQKIVNIVLFIPFALSLGLLVRWSTVKIFDIFSANKFINYLFVTNKEADSVLLSIVSGYVIGYVTYALTVLVPTFFRNKPMQIQFAKELQELYSCSVGTLLVIYKSVSTQREWQNIDISDDLCALNDEFYAKVKYFDLCSEAYTIFGSADGKKYSWSEYLVKISEKTQEKARQILLCYQAYLSETMYDILVDTINDKFLGMITGECTNIIPHVIGENEYMYFESISVADYYESTDNPTPIFLLEDNLKVLKQYISLLHRQKFIICAILGKDKALKSNYYLNEMKNNKIGKCESAIWRKVETNE